MLYKCPHIPEAEHFRFLPPLVPRVSTYSLRVKTAVSVLALLSLLILISCRLQFVIQQFPFTINLCSAPRLADKFLKAKCSNFSAVFWAQPFSADFGKIKQKNGGQVMRMGVFFGFF